MKRGAVADEDPMVRVACPQALLSTLRDTRPEEFELVRGALSPEAARSFESPNGLAWVPMAHHMELSDLIRGVVGVGRGNIMFWEQAFEALLRKPLLISFVQMVLRIADAPEKGILRHGPRIFDYVFRGCGLSTTEVAQDPARPEFVGTWNYVGFPAKRFTFPCFVEGFQGALQGAGHFLQEGKHLDVDVVDWAPHGRFFLEVYVRRS